VLPLIFYTCTAFNRVQAPSSKCLGLIYGVYNDILWVLRVTWKTFNVPLMGEKKERKIITPNLLYLGSLRVRLEWKSENWVAHLNGGGAGAATFCANFTNDVLSGYDGHDT